MVNNIKAEDIFINISIKMNVWLYIFEPNIIEYDKTVNTCNTISY